MVGDVEKIRRAEVLVSLRAIDGPKTVVLVSESLAYNDIATRVDEVGALAASARTNIDVLKLDDPQFQISATGRIQEQGGKQFFVAGKDKFVVRAAANAPKIPTNTAVSIEAILNDKIYPMELRVMTFKPVAQ